MHRIRLILPALTLGALLCLSSCAGPAGDTVIYATPLPQPAYREADIAPFDGDNPFGRMYNTFIFKGKIDRIQEINLIQTRVAGGESSRVDDWYSVCDVTVQSTLFGEAPGKQESVKLLFGQTSRQYDKSGFALVEGQEYYFITYGITEYDRTNRNPVHKYADLVGGVYYDIFPVSDGVVRCQGWKFEGAKELGKMDPGAGLYHEDITSIDEQSFLKQFTAMIEEAKAKADAEAGAAGTETS